MTQITMSFEDVIQAMEELIAERGDTYVYLDEAGKPSTDCVYVYSNRYQPDTCGKPACAVGNIIAKLDPALFAKVVEFEEERGTFGVPNFGGVIEDGEHSDSYPPRNWDARTEHYLMVLQEQQDRGRPWSLSHRTALASVEDRFDV